MKIVSIYYLLHGIIHIKGQINEFLGIQRDMELNYPVSEKREEKKVES